MEEKEEEEVENEGRLCVDDVRREAERGEPVARGERQEGLIRRLDLCIYVSRERRIVKGYPPVFFGMASFALFWWPNFRCMGSICFGLHASKLASATRPTQMNGVEREKIYRLYPSLFLLQALLFLHFHSLNWLPLPE